MPRLLLERNTYCKPREYNVDRLSRPHAFHHVLWPLYGRCRLSADGQRPHRYPERRSSAFRPVRPRKARRSGAPPPRERLNSKANLPTDDPGFPGSFLSECCAQRDGSENARRFRRSQVWRAHLSASDANAAYSAHELKRRSRKEWLALWHIIYQTAPTGNARK